MKTTFWDQFHHLLTVLRMEILSTVKSTYHMANSTLMSKRLQPQGLIIFPCGLFSTACLEIKLMEICEQRTSVCGYVSSPWQINAPLFWPYTKEDQIIWKPQTWCKWRVNCSWPLSWYKWVCSVPSFKICFLVSGTQAFPEQTLLFLSNIFSCYNGKQAITKLHVNRKKITINIKADM